eukprot:5105940-Amphidinium_carterae.2
MSCTEAEMHGTPTHQVEKEMFSFTNGIQLNNPYELAGNMPLGMSILRSEEGVEEQVDVRNLTAFPPI